MALRITLLEGEEREREKKRKRKRGVGIAMHMFIFSMSARSAIIFTSALQTDFLLRQSQNVDRHLAVRMILTMLQTIG